MPILKYCKPAARERVQERISTIQALGTLNREESISGLLFEIHTNAILIILKSWLASAWKRHNWQERMPAIGLNISALRFFELWNKLIFVVDGSNAEVYVCSPEMILRTCSSWIEERKGVKLVAVPKSMLYRYKGEPIEGLIKYFNSQ